MPTVSYLKNGLANKTTAAVGDSKSNVSKDTYFKVGGIPMYYYGIYLINYGTQTSLANIQSYIMIINNRGGNSLSTFRGIKLSSDAVVKPIGYHRESNVLYLDFKFDTGTYPFVEIKPLLNFRSYLPLTLSEVDSDLREADIHF